MTTLHTVSFQKTVLASLIGLCLSQSIFALENLEQLDDAALSQATGEGIAMLPENFRMVFQGANDNTTQQLTDYTNRAKDTGYIRYIPVGPLTAEATASGAQKADMFLYGLAISRADNDINNRYNSSATGQIKSWGSADNPWLLKVQSATIPNFAGEDGPLSYLSYEAPAYDIAGFANANSDDYQLKLGLWADIFMRDPTVAAPDNNPAGWGAGLSNRLRLQAIWNGFSINGSSINLFQTLGGAANAAGLSTSYNNTLGLSGTLRFNSGDSDSSTLRANITADSSSRTYDPASGWNEATTPTEPSGGCDNNFSSLNCQYRFRNRTVTDTQTNVTWSLVPALAAKVLRFSTRGVAGENASTPAIDAAATAPTFDATEGLFFYGANFNLTLGSLYQPLVIGVADDNRNLTMEITRIPNQANVYQKIYTDYANPTSTTYLGSTCNVYQCGRTVDGVFYPATHSSISVGSTNYDNSGSKNQLSAYQQADAIGISFGALPATYNQNGTFTKQYNEVQYQQRAVQTAQYVVTDRYRLFSLGQTQDDPYLLNRRHDASGLGGGAESNYDFRWYNLAATHNYWGYVTGYDTNGKPIFGDTAGRNLIAGTYTVNGVTLNDTCTTDYTCLGGVAVAGAGGYKDSNGNWVGGVGSVLTEERPNDWTAGWRDSGAMNTALGMLGFVAGIEDCGTDQSGTDCQGDGGDLESVRGVSRLTDGYYNMTPNTAANASWTNASRTAGWFNASNDRTATSVYNSMGTLKADYVPSQITAVNPSPLNNLGSAVIDGVLIQHMKLTTKGL